MPRLPTNANPNIVEIPSNEDDDSWSDGSSNQSGSDDDENLPPEEVTRMLSSSASSNASAVPIPVSKPAPLSTVPLASSRLSPAEELKQQQKAVLDAQEERELQERLSKPPTPTRAQVNAEAAKQIGANIANQTTSSLHNELQNQKKMNKEVTEAQKKDADGVGILCHKLNLYRQQYQGKINWKFKPSYTPAAGFSALQAEKAQIELILNSSSTPAFLKETTIRLTELLEFWVFPMFGLDGGNMTADVKTMAEADYFKDELEQLAIEMADYFSFTAKQRFAQKYGFLLFNRVMQNYQVPGSGAVHAAVKPKAVHSDL